MRSPTPTSPRRTDRRAGRLAKRLAAWLAPAAIVLAGPALGSDEDVDKLVDSVDRYLNVPTSEIEAGSDLPGRPVTLNQALALAVQHNLNVEVARYEPLASEQDALASWGAYDPNFLANVGYDLAQDPNTNILNRGANLNQSRTIDGGASINTLLPFIGATLGVELETQRQTSKASFAALTPQYDSSLFLTANVPLMRGLIWNEPWTQVKVTKISYGRSQDDFRREVMDITESTINFYWALVANKELREVAEKSLETSVALLDQTRTQYEVGVVSKVDVVEAEAGVAEREFDLIVAQNNFENSGDDLIDAVLGRELRATMEYRLEPEYDPEAYEIRRVDVEQAVAIALSNLPELAAADRTIEQREVELKFAKNQRLPQFDIDARYGYLNRSGDANNRACAFAQPVDPINDPNGPVTPGCNPGESLPDAGNWGKSFDDFFDNDEGFENYSVRGTFSIPLGNRTASRRVTRSRIDLRRAKSQRVRTEQRAILVVRQAARGLLATARGIEAAERRRLAAEEQLRAERVRLEHGESTPFDVLLREQDLVDAESQKIGALQAYRDSEARLERAQGTILDTHNIRIDDVRADPMR